jgi:predicted dehydrogenase
VTARAPCPVGVIGVGSLGFHHARLLRDLPGAKLSGIFDIDAQRADNVSRELGVRAFPSVEALLGDSEAAVLAVPTTAHAEVALQALEHRVSLLIEKPIAATLADADAILQAAESAGVLVATGHVERFNAAVRACAPYVEEPRFVESHRLAPFGPRGTDVAVVLDLMIHDIDLILGLTGAEVTSVDAIGVPILTSSVDIANARLGFAGGAVANITASRVSQDRMRKIRIFQRSGYISIDLAKGTGEFLRMRGGASLGMVEGPPGSLADLVERVELAGDGREPLRAELESFVAAVRGEGDVVVSGRDGRRALAVALDIVQRIESHVLDAHPA